VDTVVLAPDVEVEVCRAVPVAVNPIIFIDDIVAVDIHRLFTKGH
jgi:hypothetical protein